jgi:hypothetical protein
VARIAFADESGITPHLKCYSIGIVTVLQQDRAQFDADIEKLKTTHGVVGEAKWKKISTGHGPINFILDGLALILDSPSATFDVIVVRKDLFNNWTILGEETAFYQTYTLLLRHITNRCEDTLEVWIDEKSDQYAKHDEVVLAIGNRMLAKLAAKGTLDTVNKASSHELLGIQLADVLTGAINTAHILAIQDTPVHKGKRLAIARLAEQIGWNHLAYDTYPNAKFNVWHFPAEHRGPSRDPMFTGVIPYVSASDLEA